MPGFLTHYLLGMETWENLPDNYIHGVIRSSNHAFLIGLQGADLFSFDLHALQKRGLSYRTASMSLHNQEYAALFNNMLDYLCSLQGREQEVCTSYVAGFLCYYSIDQMASPYIVHRAMQDVPPGSSGKKVSGAVVQVENIIDTVLLRSHCHMEPSQLNFEALTFASKKDLAVIGKLLRYAFMATYHYRISLSEIAVSLKNLRRKTVYLQPGAALRRVLTKAAAKTPRILPGSGKIIYEDFQPDEKDYMNADGRPWYPYPGCPSALHLTFDDIYRISMRKASDFLESLDSCLSWGMSREDLISAVINYIPYGN